MLEATKPGETFAAISDHDCVRESIEEYLGSLHFSYSIEELNNDIYRIFITKDL